MLTFYRDTENNFTRWVEEKLQEMVVARRIISVNKDQSLPEDIERTKLPLLTDGHEYWAKQEDIRDFLENLHQDLLLSRSMQSDACYLDPDNPGECL